MFTLKLKDFQALYLDEQYPLNDNIEWPSEAGK